MKDTGSQVHCKSTNISETVQDRRCYYRPLNWKWLCPTEQRYFDNLEWSLRSITYCEPLQIQFISYGCAADDKILTDSGRRAVPLKWLSLLCIWFARRYQSRCVL